MSDRKYGPEALQAHVGVLKSRMGTFYPGSHVVFRGHDLHRDLKDMEWMELYVYGITGRRVTPPQLRLLNAMWSYTSYPDVRLWNNRVAALAGSARSTGTLGLAAALAVSEASIYGGGVIYRSLDFFIRTKRRLDCGDCLEDCVREELKTNRSIGGFGRPLVNADERIEPLLKLAHELGLDAGEYLQLAYEVEQMLLAGRWRLRMNYVAFVAALVADMGFSPREYYLFAFPAFMAGMPPGYIEAVERSEGTLYPLACADILYEGESRRSWLKSGKNVPL